MIRVRFKPSGAPGPICFGGPYDFAHVILKEINELNKNKTVK